MKTHPNRTNLLFRILTGIAAAVCLTASLTLTLQEAFTADERPSGAVYTMTNATAGNSVLVFSRAANGSLTPAGSFATGGLGSGGSLGNQGGLALSWNKNWLFAVNAGSNDISSFEVGPRGLKLLDRIPSGGERPVSLTLHGNILYVLNAGSDNISGFVTRRGKLSSLPGSTRLLSSTAADPAQVEFSPDGDLLVVTEKATNVVDTFIVSECGLAGLAQVQPSAGTTPFGFAFDRLSRLFVSEAFGGVANASALSSYALSQDGNLQVISPSVGTNQTAACWVAITNDGHFAYVSNTGSASISAFAIARNGSLALLNSRAAQTGDGPIDMALTAQFLYVLNRPNGTIGNYRVEQDGSLVPLPDGIAGLPTSVNGLAAR